MVLRKTNKSKTIKTKKSNIVLFLYLFLIFLTSLILVLGFLVIYFKLNKTNKDNIGDDYSEMNEDDSLDEPETPDEPKEPVINEINFQTVIDEWVNSVRGSKSVLVYDLELDKLVGEYNTNENYNTASLYKLFVVYEGYRRLESGEWNADELVGTTRHTVLECLDLAIRESNSECAEPLWNKIGHSELDRIISDDFKISDSTISSLISNPMDIMKMLKLFYEHPDIKNEALINRMKDSFLNQPVTTYDWRQGLPSGFNKANVYNKVGWSYNPSGRYWDIYHDAAIVEFPEENRHFIVIVMTNQVSFTSIRNLGNKLENFYYQ